MAVYHDSARAVEGNCPPPGAGNTSTGHDADSHTPTNWHPGQGVTILWAGTRESDFHNRSHTGIPATHNPVLSDSRRSW